MGPWERVMDGKRLCSLSEEVTVSGLYFFFNGRILVVLFLRKMFIYSGASSLSCSRQDHELWHASSCLCSVGSSCLTRDGTQAPCTGSLES